MEKNYFYSQTELGDMIHALSMSSASVTSLSKVFAKKFGRGETGVMMKLNQLAKGIVRPVREKKPAYIKKEKASKIVVEKVKALPKTLGIDIPEGTSFDFTNVKRVVLQKKSLTIYF
jgi:hypothetical protein